MKHKVKVTVLDKKLYPELQKQYCADPCAGMWCMASVRRFEQTIGLCPKARTQQTDQD